MSVIRWSLALLAACLLLTVACSTTPEGGREPVTVPTRGLASPASIPTDQIASVVAALLAIVPMQRPEDVVLEAKSVCEALRTGQPDSLLVSNVIGLYGRNHETIGTAQATEILAVVRKQSWCR